MRILLLNWRDIRNPLAGGAEIHIWKVFSRIVQQGARVAACCASFPDAEAYDNIDGVEVYRGGGPLAYWTAAPRLYRRAQRAFRPDVVIDFLNKAPLLSPLYVREPLFCFVHHLFGDAAPQEFRWPIPFALKFCESLVPRIYAHVPFLAGSQSALDELHDLGIPQDLLHFAPYGVETAQYRPGTKSPEPMIAFIGRLKRYKGVHHLIAAAPKLLQEFPHLQIKIAGDGDAVEEWRDLARRLHVEDHVEFLGAISEEEKVRLYQQAWTMCFPSLKEGFGLTVAEAALCETPTVAFDAPGLRDAVSHNATGLLAPYGDVDALRDALENVLRDETLRNALSVAARRRYANFSWDNAANVFLATLTRLAKERYGIAIEPFHSKWA